MDVDDEVELVPVAEDAGDDHHELKLFPLQ